jgi:hypothetical protein
MPPELPIEEKVMVAIADRLSTIVAGAHYHTTPALITRALLSIDQYAAELEAGPVLGIMRSSGSTEEQETLTSRVHQLVVTVWGYVREGQGVIAGDWLARLWQDHRDAIRTDPTLGGLVRDVSLDGRPRETDEGALEPLAFFAQDWLITARED